MDQLDLNARRAICAKIEDPDDFTCLATVSRGWYHVVNRHKIPGSITVHGVTVTYMIVVVDYSLDAH